MEQSITKFEYKGVNISFEFSDGNKMINATEMAKPFAKPVGNFLRLSNTKEYIHLLESRYSDVNIGKNRDVLRVVKGGSPELQGTWMDEKLALKFASWLAPVFELWVYDKIHELLLKGKTSIDRHKPTGSIIKSIRLIVDQFEYHEKEIDHLKENIGEIKGDIGEIKHYISDLEAKILSIDENYYSISGYCALNHIDCPLDKAQKWGIEAAKLSRNRKVQTGKAYDAKYGEINTYHLSILDEVFK